MRKLKFLAVVFMVCMFSGCASMLEGDEQSVFISTSGNKDTLSTVCTVSNDEGSWSIFPPMALAVPNDDSNLVVECANDKQKGEATSKTKLQAGYIALDFMIDLCIISCLVDLAGGAAYQYDDRISVPMR